MRKFVSLIARGLALVLLLTCVGCEGSGLQAPPQAQSPAPGPMPSVQITPQAVPQTVSEAVPEAQPGTVSIDPPAPVFEPVYGAPVISANEYPAVDGSTATIPLSRALAALVTGETDDTLLDMMSAHTKTSGAYLSILYGGADLLLVYAPAADTQQEIDLTEQKLTMTPIGADALVFLVNEENPVESLTVDQIRAIYAGKIKNWREVGGTDTPIMAYTRNAASGSQALMDKLVMGDTPMAAPAGRAVVINEMAGLIDAVSAYDNSAGAIGYSVFYYVNNMYMQPGIKLIKVDGIAPGNDTIGSGEYPLVNPFYAVIRENAPMNSPERRLFDFMTSEGAKDFIESCGYAAMRGIRSHG